MPADDDDTPLWGATQIAPVIRRPSHTTLLMIARGELPGRRISGRWCTTRRALKRFFNNESTETPLKRHKWSTIKGKEARVPRGQIGTNGSPQIAKTSTQSRLDPQRVLRRDARHHEDGWLVLAAGWLTAIDNRPSRKAGPGQLGWGGGRHMTARTAYPIVGAPRASSSRSPACATPRPCPGLPTAASAKSLSTAKRATARRCSRARCRDRVLHRVQYGADLETIRKALCRDAQGRASGPLGCALDRIVEVEP